MPESSTRPIARASRLMLFHSLTSAAATHRAARLANSRMALITAQFRADPRLLEEPDPLLGQEGGSIGVQPLRYPIDSNDCVLRQLEGWGGQLAGFGLITVCKRADLNQIGDCHDYVAVGLLVDSLGGIEEAAD